MRHLPELDAEALQWLGEVIADRVIFEHGMFGDFPEYQAEVVNWFLSRSSNYVRYHPPVVHARDGCGPSGYWAVRTDRVDRDMRIALHEARDAWEARERTIEARRYPQLEDWLRAEASGVPLVAPPEEPRGVVLLKRYMCEKNRKRIETRRRNAEARKRGEKP